MLLSRTTETWDFGSAQYLDPGRRFGGRYEYNYAPTTYGDSGIGVITRFDRFGELVAEIWTGR
jgi:hypothetical protein